MNYPYCNKEMGGHIISMQQCLLCYGEPMVVDWNDDQLVPLMNVHMGVTFIIKSDDANEINYYINYSPLDGHTVVMSFRLDYPKSFHMYKNSGSAIKQIAEFYSKEIITPSNVREYFDRILKLLVFT